MEKEFGIIGNGHHSKRVQKILKLKNKKFFVTNSKDIKLKKTLNRLNQSKAIFIISPNNTHFEYLEKFRKSNYIFCEKPPVSNKKQLTKIKNYNYRNIYFNFNKRFSIIAETLSHIKKKFQLGELVYANMISSKGLSTKKEYKDNWRSNIKHSKKGVFETVSIHDIDLINYFFVVKKIHKPDLKNFSKVGTSFDTSLTKIELKNESLINIFSTYYSSLIRKSTFFFKNGVLEFDINKISLRYPTKTFDKNKNFLVPKIKFQKTLSFDNDYLDSLTKSINYFLKIVDKNQNFKKKDFDISIKSNGLLF